MIAMQMPSQQSTANSVEAIWTLIQCQTKSVQRALTKRFVALDAEQRAQHRANVITPELQVRLETSRQDIKEGRGSSCQTKEELQSLLASL